MRTFVMGDIHGAYQALLQCLQRSGFDRAADRLIVLGDVCDVFPDVRACVDELLKIEHCDYLLGNHDLWALDWATLGLKAPTWLAHGGDQTILSYAGGPVPREHLDFFNRAHASLEVDGRAFVHAGFDPARPLKEQSLKVLAWDRKLLNSVWALHETHKDILIGGYREIYLGHTPTTKFGSTTPLHLGNVWAMDTGAGWTGVLTMMDVDSKEYWQSDPTARLYDQRGRGHGRE